MLSSFHLQWLHDARAQDADISWDVALLHDLSMRVSRPNLESRLAPL